MGMRYTIALLVLLLGVQAGLAQIHGVPPSVTSLRPGAGFSNAPRPSVTSLGPFGWTVPDFTFRPNDGFARHRGHRIGGANSGVLLFPFLAPYPVYPLLYPDASGTSDESAEYGQPELVDPPSQRASVLAAHDPPPQPAAKVTGTMPAAASPIVEAPAQEATVLVLRDGHQMQVRNYAIVGDQVYNFSDSGPRRIALHDVDVAATRRVNDDNGVFFNLPAK